MTEPAHNVPLRAEEGRVYVEVSGLTGTGKSAVMGEIEIALKALGLQVEYGPDFQAEKNGTHADWQVALDLYRPTVVLAERNVPHTPAPAGEGSATAAYPDLNDAAHAPASNGDEVAVDWMAAVDPLCEAATKGIEAPMRLAMDTAYEHFMNGVQDWLKENVRYNLSSLLAMHERERAAKRLAVEQLESALSAHQDREARAREALERMDCECDPSWSTRQCGRCNALQSLKETK